jgi:hypothetical protein
MEIHVPKEAAIQNVARIMRYELPIYTNIPKATLFNIASEIEDSYDDLVKSMEGKDKDTQNMAYEQFRSNVDSIARTISDARPSKPVTYIKKFVDSFPKA